MGLTSVGKKYVLTIKKREVEHQTLDLFPQDSISFDWNWEFIELLTLRLLNLPSFADVQSHKISGPLTCNMAG